MDGTAEAVRLLNEAGYKVIVITNQAGVARGYYTEADVKILHDYMNEVLERDGAHVDAFYYCPHHPEHGIGLYKKKCHCRKPETGMFEMAERDLPEGIDKVHSYMIGDKRIDAQAGKNFGVTGVLVGTGYGAKEHAEDRAAGLIKEDGSCPAGGYDAYAETLHGCGARDFMRAYIEAAHKKIPGVHKLEREEPSTCRIRDKTDDQTQPCAWLVFFWYCSAWRRF